MYTECDLWRKWREGENQLSAWFYDHDKGAAVVRVATRVLRPNKEDLDKFRDI